MPIIKVPVNDTEFRRLAKAAAVADLPLCDFVCAAAKVAADQERIGEWRELLHSAAK